LISSWPTDAQHTVPFGTQCETPHTDVPAGQYEPPLLELLELLLLELLELSGKQHWPPQEPPHVLPVSQQRFPPQ